MRPIVFLSNLRLALVSLIALSSLLSAPALAAPYADNGNGSVTDSGTGLTWKRCAEGQTWTGSSCSGTPGTFTWAQATALTGTVSFAGRSDWRLPNIRELQTLVDRARYGPVLDPAAFPNAPNSVYAWSATPVAANAGNAWKLHLSGGLSTYAGLPEANVVLMVRADALPGAMNPARPAGDYFDNGDGTLTHAPTGLMWQRCAKGQTWTGSDCSGSAILYAWALANSLADNFAGASDWRLPTEDELLSLVDYTLAVPALNATLFPATPFTKGFWSATANFLHPGNAWETDFDRGGAIANSFKATGLYVRLVRRAGVALQLATAWNLVGNSTSGSLDVAAAFGDANKVSTVWKWIASSAKWAFFAPSLAGPALTDYASSKGYEVLTTINGGEGFWVNARTAFALPPPVGTAIASTAFQTMPSGWSLIAIGDNKTPSQFNALLGAAAPLTTLWAWDAALANWYFYAPSLEAQGGTALSSYIAGKGFLDFTTASKTLTPGVGFWVNRP